MLDAILGISILLVLVVPAYACLCLSGRISDEEEKRDADFRGKEKLED